MFRIKREKRPGNEVTMYINSDYYFSLVNLCAIFKKQCHSDDMIMPWCTHAKACSMLEIRFDHFNACDQSAHFKTVRH